MSSLSKLFNNKSCCEEFHSLSRELQFPFNNYKRTKLEIKANKISMSIGSYDTLLEEQDEDDRNVQMAKFYDKKIEEERVILKKNQIEQEKLREKLESLKEQVDNLEEENEDLESNNKTPDFENMNLSGDFFQQLRTIEAANEIAQSRIHGLKVCNSDLQGEIQVNSLRYKRILAQNEDIKQKILHSETLRGNRESDLSVLKDSIVKLQIEEEKLKDLLINIKDASRKKADQIKKVAQESVDDIFTQREVLISKIEELKEEISKLKDEEKEEKRISLLADVKRQEIRKTQNSKAWINERSALVAKVKKARMDYQSLQRRNNANASRSKASTPTLRKSPIKRVNNLTDDQIKKALFLEIQEITNTDIKFLQEALKTEEKYELRLKYELEQIDKSIEHISNFKDSTVQLLDQQTAHAQNTHRIELLQQELKELQSQL